MKVAKWGNSLAVRLPIDVAEALSLKEGDDVELYAMAPSQFGVHRKPTREEMWAAVRKLRGRMPKDFKFDREEANERG